MRKKSPWRVAVFCLVGIVCLNAVAAFFVVDPIWFSQQYESFQNKSKKGFVSRYYYDSKGKKINYVVFVPYNLKPQDNPPLILHLHGAGKRGLDGTRQLRDGIATTIWERKRNFPFVVLFPQEPKDTFWVSDQSLTMDLLKLLDSTISEYHVDPDRVSIGGLSSGGNSCWKIVSDYPERFAAIFPLSSGCDEKLILDVAKSNISIWNFHVYGDSDATYKCHNAIFQKLLKMGYSPHLTELDGYLSEKWSRHNSWDYATRNLGFLKWLLKQNRKANQKGKNSFQLILQEEDSSRWQLPAKQWSINDNKVLSHRCSSKEERIPFAYQNKDSDYELHLEFKVEKGTGCRLLFPLESDRSDADFLEVYLVPPEQGSGKIIRTSDRKWIQTANKIAQQAFRHQQWNDLRIKVFEGKITIRLNEAELYSLDCNPDFQLNNNFSLSTLPSEDGLTHWRYMRMRKLKQ